MIVSWKWLRDYVELDVSPEEFAQRLMMAGLNHEGTETYEDDFAIDLEVTSNRPDCLGHLGIGREAAVLFGRPLRVPTATLSEGKVPIADLTQVQIDCPDLCPRYTARLIQGVKVRPSPDWMVHRLEAVGITPINNLVDVSNYVMMECGQPLHTFDFAKLEERRIIVRRAEPGEVIEAIDHKSYSLSSEVCVIADAHRPVAIGGVMGGAATEISSRTTEVLVEAAEFDPISIRTTAGQLDLHSDSSYRFERKVDPEGVDWASRRCCELILQLGGGQLARGVIDVGRRPPERHPIVLRLSQLPRVLGIEIDQARVRQILAALGLVETASDPQQTTWIAPSWRRDLTREIDLVEEVGRIHGYEHVPEDVRVPMAASQRTREDRVLTTVRQTLVACGFDEAMTLSAVDEKASDAFSPWTEQPALRTRTPVLRGADRLRRSLVPSLLAARRTNEALANPQIELFEIARVYLSRPEGLPLERRMLGLASGRSFLEIKGVIEALVAEARLAEYLSSDDAGIALLDPATSCRLCWGRDVLGYVGQLSTAALEQFELRGPCTVAEIDLGPLIQDANLVPKFQPISAYPAVLRDLNLVVDESVRWADLADTVRDHAGGNLESVQYVDTYRDPQRLGEGKKSLLLTLVLRSKEGTLTNHEADQIREQIVAACTRQHGARLRA